MNHKVLLADDSLTIQKVIKITLANQPYDITDCSTEEDMFRQLPALQPKLVFLDFNLSEKYTGYDLTAKIKSLSPTSKVLLLLGTFDSVDDAAMEKCGASDKIVKPFDSNKFIAICKHLIETFADDDLAYPEAKPAAPAATPRSNPEDQWEVSHSTEQTFSGAAEPLDGSFPQIDNPLLKEMNDWGMSVPGIIDNNAKHDNWIDLPPVIGGDEEASAMSSRPESPTKFPQTADLDYPSVDAAPKSEPESNLYTLNPKLDGTPELQLDSYFPNESDVKVIEAQIKDEVEDNLWQADEFEDLKREVSAKMEEAKSTFEAARNDLRETTFTTATDADVDDWEKSFSFDKETPTHQPAAPAAASLDEMRAEMEAMVKKYVQEYMDQMFKKNVEKVSWEVIPDLAENLIRQELSKISHKIMDDPA